MKKIIFLIIVLISFISCRHKQSNKQIIQRQIIAYQQQVTKINKNILDLQKQLNVEKLEKKNKTTGGLKFRVRTAKAQRSLFRHYFDASAEVQAVNDVFISAEVNGQILKIYVVEGDRVKKGQLLARLETDMIENNINELKTSLELAKLTYKKQKELWDKHIGSEMQYLQAKTKMETLEDKLKTLQTQYDKSFIKSPISGYVEAVDLKEGELAMPGIKFIHIVNLDEMYITAQLSEVYLPIIKEGDWVSVRFTTYPEIHLKAAVFRIGTVINKQSRTFAVKLKIKNPGKLLKPNLLAIIRINDYTNPKAIVVPSILIKEDIQGYYLYVINKKSGIFFARKRYVKIGKSMGSKTQIVEGLNTGEVYITDGYNNVNNGTIVEIQ